MHKLTRQSPVKVWQKSRLWLAVILALLATVVATSAALAHATLLRSDPTDNAVLAEPPETVRLWFSESISPEFSSAQLLDINGQPVELPGIQVVPTESLMVLTLPELSPGLYSVRWKVLSETDGHFTQGLLVFGVGEGVNMEAATVAEPEVSLPLPEIGLRWFNFGLLMSLVGAMAVLTVVLVPAAEDRPAEVGLLILEARRRVATWALWCSGLALLVGLGLLSWQIVTLTETLPEGVPFYSVGWQVLSKTRWGMLWLIRQGLLLVLTGMLFAPVQSRLPGKLVWSGTRLLVLGMITVQALTGHAAALTPNTALAVAADALHLLAAGMWVGGLLSLIIGLLPPIRRQRTHFGDLVRAGWRPFSRLAALSVGVVVATGLYSTGRQVASVDALITTLYGRALLGKVILMLGVGALGLLNSMLLHPHLAAPLARLLRRPAGWTLLSLKRLPLLVLAEAGLGLLVVLIVGLITATQQANGPEFTPTEGIPTALTQSVDDVLVTFSAKPNRPGQNVFTVRAVSTRRPPPAEVMRVILRFTYLGQDMGRTSADAEEIEPGLYQLGGNYFSLAGPWQVEVVVRRRGLEDSVARFHWTVAPPGEGRPVVLSNRPWESPLTVAAAGMILALLLVTAGVWLARNGFVHSPKRNLCDDTVETNTHPWAAPEPDAHRL